MLVAMAPERATSLSRALDILNTLGTVPVADGDGVGVVQIARLIGREKSQVSRTLKTLAEAGYVERDPDTLGYRLGWRVFALATGAGNQRLRAVAPPVLRRLAARVGERAHITVLEGSQAVTVLAESSTRAVQAAGWIGFATPLPNTASGRALLLDHSDAEVRALLGKGPYPRSGPKAPANLEDLLSRLGAERRRGYTLVSEEYEPGLVTVAAPIRDFSQRTVAALNVSGPKFRFGRSAHAVGREVQAAAEQLSAALTSAEPRQPPKNQTSPGRRPA